MPNTAAFPQHAAGTRVRARLLPYVQLIGSSHTPDTVAFYTANKPQRSVHGARAIRARITRKSPARGDWSVVSDRLSPMKYLPTVVSGRSYQGVFSKRRDGLSRGLLEAVLSDRERPPWHDAPGMTPCHDPLARRSFRPSWRFEKTCSIMEFMSTRHSHRDSVVSLGRRRLRICWNSAGRD